MWWNIDSAAAGGDKLNYLQQMGSGDIKEAKLVTERIPGDGIKYFASPLPICKMGHIFLLEKNIFIHPSNQEVTEWTRSKNSHLQHL